MQIKFFIIPLRDIATAQKELNKFLRSHRILQTEKHFSPENGGYWTVAAEFMDGDPVDDAPPALRQRRHDVDYSKELAPDEFRRFEYFRKVRAEISRRRGLRAYLVFSNAELAELARFPVLSQETLVNVKNVNEKRLREFAHYFFNSDNDEESWKIDDENSRYGESQGGVSQSSKGKEQQERGDDIPTKPQQQLNEDENADSNGQRSNDELPLFYH